MGYFGRIVHFTYSDGHTYAGRVFPAIVTSERTDEHSNVWLDLCVFSATPDAMHNVLLHSTPARGHAHAAQRSNGSWSEARYVDGAGDAFRRVQQAGGDADEELQPAGGQPVEFSPELPGAGMPIADTSSTDADVIINELPPPVSETGVQPVTFIAPDGVYQTTGGTPVRIIDGDQPVSALREDEPQPDDSSDGGSDKGGPI